METNQQDDEQIEWDGGDQSTLQPDALAIQQLLNSDSMPNGIGPGEVMYVMVGSTTYQITGPQEAGGEVSIAPVTNLEELASIGVVPEGAEESQQDDITQEDGGVQEADQQAEQQEMEQITSQQMEQLQDPEQQQTQQEDNTEQQQAAVEQQRQEDMQENQPDHQQQLGDDESNQPQQQLIQNLTEQQQEQLLQEQQQQQILQQQQQELLQQQQQELLLQQQQQQNQEFLQQEQPTTQQQQVTQHSSEQQQLTTTTTTEANKLEGTTISLAGGDFVLQPGQQLPPEIQEMIAKGLPIDMSNFEFVVDDEQQPQQPPTTTSNNNTQNDFQYNNNTENINPVDHTEDQPKNGIFVQVVTACPGEFDDGEFPQLPTSAPDQRLNNSDPYIIPKSFYLSQFINYINSGGKVVPSGVKMDQQQQQQQYNPVQQDRSILLNNQLNNKFKRKRMVENDEEEDVNWKLNDPKRQRVKQQRMSSMPPNISRHNSKVINQQELMKLHQATSAANHLIFDMPIAYIMQNEPHNYQKGDFVVDKKDAYQSSFPMWRIESSKLLQKFEPFVEKNIYQHKSASVYSSWSGDIRTNFRAVLADILSTFSAPIGRKQEIIVRVHNKYVPKPADEKLEQNALMQFFNIYVHVLLNQVFEPAYLTAIRQQNVDYYLEPMTQIDQLIAEAKQGVLLECNWSSAFQVALEMWSTYTYVPLRPMDVKQQCQAVTAGGGAVKVVKFYGHSYNPETLQTDQEVNIGNNRAVEFLVGRAAMTNLGVYHALHHFKYLLFKRCHDEAVFQVSTQKKSSSDVPDICIQNRIWVQQMFQDLKGLLDRYIIIKTEEENAEGSQQ